MTDVHIVREGDTLSKIARQYGTTIKDLQAINRLSNIHRLRIGQRIRVNKDKILGVQALFLDRDRNPIPGLVYQIEFAGRLVSGTTSPGGLTERICTNTADDEVRVLIQRLDHTWKEVARVYSGYGSKLVTLVSPSMKVEAKTQLHPPLPVEQLPDKHQPIEPLYDKNKAPPPILEKKVPGLVATMTKTAKNEPLAKVEGEILDLSEFFDVFNGDFATDADYEWAAKELKLELEVIKTFAIVESGASTGGGFLQLGNRKVPTILYERHKFSAFTKHQYGHQMPDISLPAPYYTNNQHYVAADDEYRRRNNIPPGVKFFRRLNSKDALDTKAAAKSLKDMMAEGLAMKEEDTYAFKLANYKRLMKAYRLNKEAALMSCSWGAFQIMGEFWATMRYKSVFHFTRCMSQSEREQVKAFTLYIKYVNPQIANYLRSRDWAKAAYAYNGPSFKQNRYDVKLAEKYKELKNKQ